MFLKSLILKGFKSFADTTRLDFEPGVTVVVGPNGSGKSNLVDAIAWVLGSQSPSSVRSAKMEDVIFAGSQKRSLLGRSEVSLVLDNELGILPLDFPEVVISRTLVRNGDSEYGINGAPTRLMDITDLLSDGGMGRSQHTIVSQGEVDAVLNDRSEDRRMIIEEAAGVLKHRKRRERAEKRLRDTDSDLSRLRDLLREVTRQLEPLERQAEAAQRHGEMLEHLNELRIYAAGRELQALRQEKENLSAKHKEHKAKETDFMGSQAALNSEIKSQELKLNEFGEDISGEDLADMESLKARIHSASASLKEKALKLDAETKAQREIKEAEEQKKIKQEELQKVNLKIGELKSTIQEQAQRNEHILQNERAIKDVQSEILVLENIKQSVQKEYPELELQLRDLKSQAEELEVTLESKKAEQEVAEAEELRWISKLEALAMTSGFASPPKSAAVNDVLGDLVIAEPGYERAVAAALGELVNSAAAGNQEAAIELSKQFKEKDAYGFVLYAKNGVEAALDQEKTLRSKVNALQGEMAETATLILDELTGSVLVADTWQEALELHLETGLMAVSLEGDCFSSARWQLGNISSNIDTELTKAARKAAETEAKASLSEIKVMLTSSRRKLNDLKAKQQKILVAKQALESRLEVDQEKITAAEGSLPELKSRLAELEVQLKTFSGRKEQELDSFRENLKSCEESKRELEISLSAISEKLTILESQVSAKLLEEDAPSGAEKSIDKIAIIAALNEFFVKAQVQVESQLEKIRTERRQKSEESRRSLQKLRESRMQKEAIEGQLADLRENLTRIEITFAEVSTRLDNAVQNLERDLECSPAKAMEAELPEFLGTDDPQKRIEEIEQELRLIGPINHLALKEYENIKTRHSFLTEQVDDIKSARKELKNLIKAVDLEMANAFESAFSDIAENFEVLFQIAFPNGEGSLQLDNPEDLLTTGVDIKARPGEKKVKRLSLLSGGERSLVALTFLFAVLKARPAPFCILDEVDAALDDINLCRFLDLVNQLIDDTQLMIVSHQKRTMEAADFLYGISMTNEGTTKVISEKRAAAIA